jgi:hypothetical protein
MKTAIHNGETVEAAPGAPQSATCPECGEDVHLYANPHCVPYYKHNVRNPDCSQQTLNDLVPRPQGAYALSLAFIKSVMKDAMNGAGVDELCFLFSPLAQFGIAQLFDTNDPYTATQEMCKRLIALDDDQRAQVHKALTWGSYRQMAEVFDQ